MKTAIDKVLEVLSKTAKDIRDSTRYTGMKTYLLELIIDIQGWQKEDMKNNLRDGSWVCPHCASKVYVLTEEDTDRVAKGTKPDVIVKEVATDAAKEETLRRAIPEQFKK